MGKSKCAKNPDKISKKAQKKVKRNREKIAALAAQNTKIVRDARRHPQGWGQTKSNSTFVNW
jgi:hypothetical protein